MIKEITLDVRGTFCTLPLLRNLTILKFCFRTNKIYLFSLYIYMNTYEFLRCKT